ncbi:MAG: hypothetical protein K6E75_08285 [Lachnospiraceae bacterium]|nr:hypothetical protein [Lachnospiraceae bacterium]
MRITNKIISNNSVTNINNNKVLEDRLNVQLATGSKIARPSDDPVVAIRALRLRTNLNQVNQYYGKNIPDANSWLDVTETAVQTVLDIAEDLEKNCVRGSVGFDTTEDRDKVLQNLKSLQAEVYATGDADYAGRFLFAGYRTNTSVTFGQPVTNKPYKITEQLDRSAIDDITYVDSANLKQLTDTNAISLGTIEQDVSSQTVHRLRLSYDNMDSTLVPEIKYNFVENDGEVTYDTMSPTVVSVNDPAQDPYTMATGSNVIFVPETGELLLGEEAYDLLMDTKDQDGTQVNEGEIRITYQKSNWEAKDLVPVHYFYCEATNDEGIYVKYNENYLQSVAPQRKAQSFPSAGNAGETFQYVGNDLQSESIYKSIKISDSPEKYEWRKQDILKADDLPDPVKSDGKIYRYTGTDTAELENGKVYVADGGTWKEIGEKETLDDADSANEGNLVRYTGQNLTNGYFYNSVEDPANPGSYTWQSMGTLTEEQFISYDVGYNQTVRVNTLAKELFSPNMGRDIDDLVRSIEDVDAMEKNIATIKNQLSSDPDNADLKERLAAAEKANTLLNDKMQKLFERGITKMQGHHSQANDALTATGNRSARVELVSNRLSKQQTNFKNLSSENEDIDMAEVAVDLSSVQLAYEASLMATGKISQTTLLNYL